MSYLVLARKWRPQTFADVIGQSHVTRTLQNALKNDRVAHALLFSGPRGVGKTSVARILAKALNCEKGPAPVPCNKCSICRQITAGHNVDVNEIDGASNRGIDEIRQLREDIRFHPAQCRFRIYIIDEVHMLTKEAFNALLKTLEEPPPHAYFVFATTEPRKIPPTIHSRCQHFEFRRLPEKELADHLDIIVEKEGLNIPRRASVLLAREAEGSVRDSLSLLDQVAAFEATSYEEVCEALGVIGVETIEKLALSILESDITSVLSILNAAYRLGSDLQNLAGDLLKFFRDLAIIKRLKPGDALAVVDMDQKMLEGLKARFSNSSFHQLLQTMQILSSSMEKIYRSIDPRMTMEVLCMRLCTLREFSGIDELILKVESLLEVYQETGGAGAPDPDALAADSGSKDSLLSSGDEPAPDVPGMSATVSAETVPERQKIGPLSLGPEKGLEDSWSDFVEAVKNKRPSLGSALDTCISFNARDDSSLEVLCRPDMTGDMLTDRTNRALLNRIAEKFFKRPVTVTCRIKRKEAAESDGRKNISMGQNGTSKRNQLVNRPLVQETINIFQARISGVTFYNNRNYRKQKTGD